MRGGGILYINIQLIVIRWFKDLKRNIGQYNYYYNYIYLYLDILQLISNKRYMFKWSFVYLIPSIRVTRLMLTSLGKPKKKGFHLMAGPWRPNTPPLEFNGRWHFWMLKKKFFFLSGPALYPPSLLMAQSLREELFFAASLIRLVLTSLSNCIVYRKLTFMILM